ncbi:DUF2247 family protein [Ralstonia solanacearum]|uniref:DUF2247 family protein n=1 Tax=Ralstonia solanacearum TaxID=305 RepID=UPI002304D945|nr:DUF2247 family protein [Ralstonia solanacearum]MDB0516028.1 DUF2247 family protein [Ralstonia solanacearum]
MIDSLFLKNLQRNWVDWGVISLGISGFPGYGILGAHFVRHFADDELSRLDVTDPVLGEVAELSLFDGKQLEDARKNVARICDLRSIDVERAKRKWRAVALEELLSQVGGEPVYDLIALGEFWADWGSATDSPFVVQGVASNLTPEMYYMERSLDETLKQHREWLRGEFESLS